MTFQPYSPPVELARAPCVRLTPQDAVLHRMFSSLGWAIFSCVSIAAMVCLVEWHEPGDPMMIGDYFPFGKVVIPMGIAGTAASLAFLFSIPVFLSGRIMPAIWLLPLIVAILWFFTLYDWYGIFNFGKPRHDVLEYRMSLLWAIFWYNGDGWALFSIAVMIIVFRWTHWQQCRIAARDAVAFNQIVADEIASRPAPKD